MSSQRCFRLLNAVDKSLYRDNILYVMVVGVALPAVFKQFGAGGYGSDNVVPDEAELQHHQKLEKLYISTRAAKVIETLCQFQRDIVRGVEGYIVTGSKQVEIDRLLKFPYVKQNSKKTGNPDVALKLEPSETKQQDLKSNMGILGKDAAAMSVVEAQQQRLTLQRLIAMMISERQRIEAPLSPIMDSMPLPPSYEEVNGVFASPTPNGSTDSMGYFLGEVMYSYQAESDVELNLSIVLQLFMFHGFDRGQTMAGPNANARGKPVGFHLGTYVERRERVLASKVAALR
ncbi:hypothetical protein RHMOL_Rhmol11G0178200 [Rhododendron molle]|uniref:Uncharacterized protein n=1 Tax=Rhododendron molle TaxID=49168 RepID=A0ACC0LU05_RHOML|nr:hypothetical protein RHMOL_Rhmol11G0178200 [Rhododendron molle]